MRMICQPTPKQHDTRIRKGFLLFPKKIGNEIRWLETAKWKERYTYDHELNSHWVPYLWFNE